MKLHFKVSLIKSYKFPDDGNRISLRAMVKAIYFLGSLIVKQRKKREEVIKQLEPTNYSINRMQF